MAEAMGGDSTPHGDGSFPPTEWNLVATAADRTAAGADQALARLCQAYWSPLHDYIRRRGYSEQDAEDLTQSYLAWFIVHEQLRTANPERGRFRSFLLVRLKHFLADQRKKEHALRRGGGSAVVSLEALREVDLSTAESVVEAQADRSFDRAWALALLEHVAVRLRAEYSACGRARLFEELQQFQAGQGEVPGASYRTAAERVGVTEAYFKSAVFNLRRRQGSLIREEVARTVPTSEEVQDELRYLIEVLRD